MASPTARITFRVALLALAFLVVFYMGRPLYWKISATIHEIRENRQTVQQGLSQIVLEAQRTVGWYHDESAKIGSGRRWPPPGGCCSIRFLCDDVGFGTVGLLRSDDVG